MQKNIYVVVCKNDGKPFGTKDEKGEIVFETYTKFASLPRAKKFAKMIEEAKRSYGKCRIAKLEFVTDYAK